MTGQREGFTVWFTGLSGAGKSTIAELLYHELRARGMKVEILDGDMVRQNLSKGLGFSKEDRDTNILRIGFVANLLTRNGVAAICCPISPYRATRNEVRNLIGDFVEVYVHATVDEIAQHRDPKGLYRKALAGEIKNFTGVDDPYEPPENPELALDTMVEEPGDSLRRVLGKLAELRYIEDSSVLVGEAQAHSGLTDLAHARRQTQEGSDKEATMLGDFEFQATIPALDLNRARKFYEEVLGIQPESEAEAGITYRCGKGSTFFLFPTQHAGTGQHTLGGWLVDDIEKAVAVLRDRGVAFEEYDFPGLKTVDGIADLGSERAAWFKDTEGNTLAVSQLIA